MTSTVPSSTQDDETVDVKENTAVTTIHRIYRGSNEEDIVFRDPNNRRSFINRPAYAKLHRSFSSGSKRHSVDNLKGRFENLSRQNSEKNQGEEEKKEPEVPPEEPKVEPPEVFTPETFGYPKTAKLKPPLIKPKPAIRKRTPKDENSNVVNRKSTVSTASDAEEVQIVLQPSASEESVDKIAKELSRFTMDGKPKERKRPGSFRKLFLGGLFGKDKKKKEEEKNKQKSRDNIVYTDNMKNETNFNKNETNFNRQSSVRQTVPNRVICDPYAPNPREISMQEFHEQKIKELELEYAQLHVNRFNSIRQSFSGEKTDNYVIMDNSKTKPSITDFISTPVNKYIDTSSSASMESEKPNGAVTRDTPPRAQETYQNITVVKPKAAIPISTERPLPNPYQNEKETPRTIERNLNKSNSKDYPDKPSFPPKPDDTYGTVFDSLDNPTSPETKPVNSKPPVSPTRLLSLESTKLKLPPNREIYEPQPRVKSPIPTNKVSTEKIIATELLKNTRSPTPPKRTHSRLSEEPVAKPPVSPKSHKKQEPQGDKIVTNALVHAPQRSQTPVDNRYYSNRSSTPIDLRMSVSMKMSPKKEDVRKSVEEYYWKQLKKMKEEEDSRLESLYTDRYYYDDPAASRVRRSRSLSPSSQRLGRKTLSLPRDSRGQNYVEYGRIPHQPIPEDQAITTTDGRSRHFIYDQNFPRNNPERRSVDSMQRPIFRRGSLTKQEIYETQPYNKRVSFSNSQAAQQGWPTRNGYTQNPPQRRLERIDSELDDDVFVPVEPLYGPKYNPQNEPLYSNRVLEQFRAQQYDNVRQQPLYGQIPYQVPPQMGVRRLSMDSISRQDVYNSRGQLVRRPTSNASQIDDYGRTSVPRYHSNSQLSLQPNNNPVYSSRQSMTDSNYGQKQITVRNKFCDIYGQIHDSPQTGIVMGQLQNLPPPVPSRKPDGFVRGSRLTASANDIGRRQNYETNYNEKVSMINYENRPLPPPPRQTARYNQISDTESGSDISEVQRIMQTKNKKKGFFGK